MDNAMKRYLILPLLFTCLNLLGNTFIELIDSDFRSTINRIANTDDIQKFIYNDYRFAVLTDKEQVRFFIISTDFSQIKGYQGTTTLGIIFHADLSVEKLEIISSQETRSYIRRLNSMGFSQRFINFKQGDEIETISSATMTSKAMIDSVNESIEIFRPIIEKWLLLEHTAE